MISLLCVPYKIHDKFIYACVKPLIDPLLPKEQAWFRRGKVNRRSSCSADPKHRRFF